MIRPLVTSLDLRVITDHPDDHGRVILLPSQLAWLIAVTRHLAGAPQ